MSDSVIICSQSPDGRLIASGAIDGIINLFDLQSGRLLHTLEGTWARTVLYKMFHQSTVDVHVLVVTIETSKNRNYFKIKIKISELFLFQ